MKIFNRQYALNSLDINYSETQDQTRTLKALSIFFPKRKYLKWKNEVIVDVGCGPNGGVIPYMPIENYLVAIDPLAKEYKQRHKTNIPIIEGLGEKIPLADKISDRTFCFNSIDHGLKHKEYFKELCRTTAGKIYLYTHLRKVTDLNAGHLLDWSLKDFEDLVEEYGEIIGIKVYKKDPTHEANYKTVFAIIKPK